MIGEYFEENSSEGIPVSLEFASGFLSIHSKANAKYIRKQWELNKIYDHSLLDEKLIVRYGEKFPFEVLILTELESINVLRGKLPEPKKDNIKDHFKKGGFQGLIYSGLILLILICLSYFFFIPWAKQKVLKEIPMETEVRIGNQIFNGMSSDLKIDTTKSILLNKFYKKLNFPSDYPVKLYVVEEEVINAFALPGGNIVIYAGLLNKLNAYEQLAALIGHELTHVNNRHSLKTITDQISTSISLSMIFGDLSGLEGFVLDQVQSLNQLSYSRSLEEESDLTALKLMYQNGINQDGMLGLLEILKENEGSEIALGFLNSHPLTEERVQYVNDNLLNTEGGNDQLLEHFFNQLLNSKEGASSNLSVP